MAWLGLAALALGAIAVAAVLWTRASPPQPVRWLSVLPPPDGFDLSPDPIVSPDGRYVAFKGQGGSHRTSIWLKPLDAPNASPIPGTEGTDYTGAAFWSPDSRSIGFFAQGKLKRIDIDGGAPQTLAAAPEPRGGTWSPSGVILFNADTRNLMRVPASGGTMTRVSEAPGVRLFPHALPDGRHYLFTSRNVNDLGQGVYVGSLDAADVKRVSDAWSPAVYASGHLLFVRERALFAQPFDMGRLEVSGDPVQIADGIGLGYGTPLTYPFSASATGVVSFWGGSSAPVTQLTWIHRSGEVLRRVSEAAPNSGLSLSKDGRRAVLDRLDPATSTNDIWLLDPESGGGSSRFTTDGRFSSPVMSPDGTRLALMERGRGIVAMPIGIGDAKAVVSGASSKWPSHWSLDGRLLAFTDSTPQGWRLWTAPVGSPDEATLYREAPFALAGLQFSPDGRWVTYMSDETGQFEVYVDSYPTPDHRIRVSPAGGGWPKWRLDGQELFYLAPDRQLMAAAITREGTGITFSPPQALFEGPGVKPDTSRAQFEPSADGSKFLFNARVELSRSVGLTVITNWPALVRK
jgi:Tol biopolymer transport system component